MTSGTNDKEICVINYDTMYYERIMPISICFLNSLFSSLQMHFYMLNQTKKVVVYKKDTYDVADR